MILVLTVLYVPSSLDSGSLTRFRISPHGRRAQEVTDAPLPSEEVTF